ncbi:MAG: hypothetical protein ACXIVO_04880 [Glycocaulis sp.]
MSTDRKTAASADLAYLREMAEAGAKAPLLGGRFMVWWGGLASLTFLTHWAVIADILPLGWGILLPMWIGFMVVGSFGQFLLVRTVRRKPGAGSMGNRVQGVVWPSVGAALMAYFFGILAGVYVGGLPAVFFNSMLAVGFAGYGMGWMIDALISRQRMLLVPAIISFAATFACAALMMTVETYLVASAGMFLGTFLPGLWVMTREPKDLV